jgi:cation diffusion facilitator CzcD-associated flavoprotein CzcO
VLVIGNANSANEMVAQLAPVGCSPVYRRLAESPYSPPYQMGSITRYSTSTSDKITVHIQDGSIIEDIDIVVFGTGYYPNIPNL